MDSNGAPHGISFGSTELVKGRVPGIKTGSEIEADSISICSLKGVNEGEIGVKVKRGSRCVGFLFIDEWDIAAMIGHAPELSA